MYSNKNCINNCNNNYVKCDRNCNIIEDENVFGIYVTFLVSIVVLLVVVLPMFICLRNM